MYLSETEVYKRFYEAVKTKVGNGESDVKDECDVYSTLSELKGMVDMIEALAKEDE